MDNQQKIYISNCFNQAAYRYEKSCTLQKNIGERFIQKLGRRHDVLHALDLGAGTGHLTPSLQQLYPDAHLTKLDIAFHMLKQGQHLDDGCTSSSVCADFDFPPFAAESFEVIFSNLALQWSLHLAKTLSTISQLLAKQGNLFFTTLGPQSLHELRSAWQPISKEKHVNRFIDRVQLYEIMQPFFTEVSIEEEAIILEFPDITQLIRHIKAYGGNHVIRSKSKGLTTLRQLKQLEDNYQSCKNANNQLPMTYQVYYVFAKGPRKRH